MEQKSFVDLFSGIGAFHQALKKYNFVCHYAVEIDKHAIETYKLNYPGTDVLEDITNENVVNKILEVKKLDMVTAGFPCQPFSKAGKMNGMDHESGDLFYSIIDLIQKYNNKNIDTPIKYLFFENVGFLKNHDDSNTWKKMKGSILQNSYKIIGSDIITNPLNFGIPQNRTRMFLFCVHESYYSDYTKKNNSKHLLFSKKYNKKIVSDYSALTFLEQFQLDNFTFLDEEKNKILEIWDEFVCMLKLTTLGFPIWLDYFGIGEDNTEKFKKNLFAKEKRMFDWKSDFFEKNRQFYLKNKSLIDQWFFKYKKNLEVKKTYRKFEWNAGNKISSIKEGIIQFRHSGVRIKKPDFFPTLVKMVHTPIVWDKKEQKYRYISIEEALSLQSFPASGADAFIFPENSSDAEAFKRIGNSINVEVISKILDYFL